ncbi:MAG: AraC family transcriptional regulator [Ruminococcus sp.]|nr:AraC family transcriptional regulator [Ruminococcus sp.]
MPVRPLHTLQIIAEKCGFDYFNFMRLFKKEMGITPTEYRKMKCLK